jgi:hypothetical protein
MQTTIYVAQYIEPFSDKWINDEAFATRTEAQQHIEKQFSGFAGYTFRINCIVFNQQEITA